MCKYTEVDMKVLVIPDVHLKPVIFQQATILMRRGIAERAVCLMDIPDDWGKEYQVELYEKTYDEAISFAKKFPETAWCYGNHDLSYFWHQLESGYSSMAAFTVQRKLLELRATVPENNPIRYVYKIDNVLFSHKRNGNVVEDWDLNNLEIGEAIVGLPFEKPFKFNFDLFRG